MRIQFSTALICTALSALTALAAPPRKDRGAVPPDAEKKIKELEKKAGGVSWDAEAQNIHQAHRFVFERNGWNSESDQFALSLLDQVTNIAPWNGHEREDAFLNGIQGRLNLTDVQRQLVSEEMRRESITVATKHFATMFPVVTEVIQTRLEKKAFTAEQVQRWSQNLKPVMDDALASLQRVTKKLEGTMNDDQKKLLQRDMDAVIKRHKAVEKMVVQWQAGNWNPTEWGLDQDPYHQAAMAEYRRTEAKRNALVRTAVAQQPPVQPSFDGADESEWEKYVQWFKDYYGCDERQRSTADSILKSCRKEAFDYLNARGKEIEKTEELLKNAEGETKKAYFQSEIQRLRKPVADIFARLCKRLDETVLTTEQLKKKPAAPKSETPPKTAQASRK